MEIITIEMTDTNKKYYWDKSKKYKKEWNELVENAPRHDAVAFYKEFKSAKGKHIIVVGEPKTIEEKLIKGFYEKKPNYISYSDSFPEDFVEGRTSFDNMVEYADEMKYFIEDLLNMI